MYDNIGGKIKGLAKATFIVEAIAAIIVGIVLGVETEESWCALIIFCGPIVAWVSSWLLYGFGEIIDTLCDIEHNTGIIMKPSELKKARDRHEAETKKVEAAKQELQKQVEEENSVIIECPECEEELFFDKDLSHAECPYCGCNIKIK